MITGSITVEYTLDSTDIADIRSTFKQLTEVTDTPTEPGFYDHDWDVADLLPPGVGRFLRNFRRSEPAGACVIRGFPVDDDAVGPTPAHWEAEGDGLTTGSQDQFLALCGLALGEPYAWATLQHGRMMPNVFPIKGDEQRLSGHGSEAFLVFHTDDAFHTDSCDYLMLFGIRNHGRVPTLISSIRDVRLSDDTWQVLFDDRFYIMPDDEHIRQLESRLPDHPALARAIQMRDDPKPVPVLFGRPDAPYLRLDGPYMRFVDDDPAAEQALTALLVELDRVKHPVVVEPGTLLVLDNHVVAHARESFTAKYDGTDRWLRKLVVSRNLRKSKSNSMPISRRVLC
jgi:L-asparagine oxygenase